MSYEPGEERAREAGKEIDEGQRVMEYGALKRLRVQKELQTVKGKEGSENG